MILPVNSVLYLASCNSRDTSSRCILGLFIGSTDITQAEGVLA